MSTAGMTGARPLSTAEIEECQTWARKELGGAGFGDTRLDRRLVEIATAFMCAPEGSIPKACGRWPLAKAAYRLFDNKRVLPELIYEAHRKQVVERCRSQAVVLAVADTTMLDYTDHEHIKGLGYLADDAHQGLLVHPTLAITPERVPLGLIDQQVWVRDRADYGKSKKGYKKLATSEKESQKWINSLRATNRLQEELGENGPQVVGIFDREGDTYDTLREGVAATTRCDFLIRAARNRRVEHPQKYLWEQLESQLVAAEIEIQVPRKPGQKSRSATLGIHFAEVTIRPPTERKISEGLEPVKAFAVYAHEVSTPPTEGDRVSWMLLTTVPVTSVDDALRMVHWYTCRWTIEILFRVLKSGCQIEERQLESKDRLTRCLAVDIIVAWRILYLTTVGRTTPNLPCTVVFEDNEWKAVWTFVHRTPQVPEAPPTLREMVRMVGSLGGHLGRKQDKEPGPMVMWRGLQRTSDITSIWLILQKTSKPHPKRE